MLILPIFNSGTKKEKKPVFVQIKKPPPHSPVLEQIEAVALIMDRDKEAAGPPEYEAVLLTGQAYSGGVHDGHQIDNIL